MIHSQSSVNHLEKMRYLARTGISVDIENLGKNTKCIAVRENRSVQELQKGVWYRKFYTEFSKNNFTNIYDVYWNPEQPDIKPVITSSKVPYFLSDYVENDANTVAAINGAFFFLADIAQEQPTDLPYNFCVRDGKVRGLPSYDQPIAYIQNGKLHAKEIKAIGTLKIGNKKVHWVGAHSDHPQKNNEYAILYNSKCSDVVKVRDPKTNIQIGILDNKNIFTPKGKTLQDVVVGENAAGLLVVKRIRKGGGTHFFDGDFILQIESTRQNSFKVGDRVMPFALEDIPLSEITAGITIGRRVDDPFFLEDVRVNRHDARSIIAEDRDGFIHFITFDGSKYIPGFKGVSAKEIVPFFKRNAFNWAYFLDGGGSSRIVFRQKGKMQFLANQFAFRKLKDGSIIWDWQNARKLASSISIQIAS